MRRWRQKQEENLTPGNSEDSSDLFPRNNSARRLYRNKDVIQGRQVEHVGLVSEDSSRVGLHFNPTGQNVYLTSLTDNPNN